ncbi:hypothetical protein AYI70_g8200 [Smittium culicis]|uniref:Uncharacterized protein n=1 Tax=Smittium culicis TaxID=133412 RepID=A0A1R1XH44_9FUNG|nr:hypothetical protein AYI70_g8200 [Smittium culicis]
MQNVKFIEWMSLAQFDDILSELLLDSTGLPFKTRKILKSVIEMKHDINITNLIRKISYKEIEVADAVESILK